MQYFQETRKRSVVKSIIWRLVATLITWGTIFWYTGKLAESIKITITGAIISMTAYYFHERIWNNIRWGKTSK